MDDTFQNIALSALWGVGAFMLAIRDIDRDTAFVIGLLVFAGLLTTLWLIVEREFSPET